jgi:hypothetical protein
MSFADELKAKRQQGVFRDRQYRFIRIRDANTAFAMRAFGVENASKPASPPFAVVHRHGDLSDRRHSLGAGRSNGPHGSPAAGVCELRCLNALAQEE